MFHVVHQGTLELVLNGHEQETNRFARLYFKTRPYERLEETLGMLWHALDLAPFFKVPPSMSVGCPPDLNLSQHRR